MSRKLPANEVLVLYSSTAEVPTEESSRRVALLQPEEVARANRYVFDKDRVNFATGRIIVRSVLAGYVGPAIFNTPFTFNQYGRPDLTGVPELAGIEFNISHATGMVVVAFSVGRAIGVDVERLDRRASTHEIARSYFAATEVELFESTATDRRSEVFFALWTLKEAYIKARGMGLSIPLRDFSFIIDPPRISFSPNIDDSPECWTFWRESLGPAYAVAVAARKGSGEPLRLRMEEFTFS